MTAILEAQSVSMTIGGATLVDGIDLRIEAGEMVAIVGPNGAGKSTLLRMLSGDLRPTRGPDQAEAARHPRLSAARSSPITARCCRSMSTSPSRSRSRRSSIWARATPAAPPRSGWSMRRCGEVGLAHFSHRQLPTLSGGEQQRAHFARVLVQLACGEALHGPGLLLLDEPTSSLDMRHQIDLVETARRRAQNGTAVIAVLHDLNLAMRFADRIVLLHRGKLAVDGGRTEAITAETIRRIFEVDVDDRLYRSGRAVPAAADHAARRPADGITPQGLSNGVTAFFTEPSANCNSRSARHCASSS